MHASAPSGARRSVCGGNRGARSFRRRGRQGERRREQAAGDRPHRGHLRGEPQLRQPVRRLGGRSRPFRRRCGAYDPARADRAELVCAVRVPVPGRREPAGAVGGQPIRAAERHLRQHDRGHVPEPLRERAFLDRRLHQPERRHLPAGAVGLQLPERAAQGRDQPRHRPGRPRRPRRRLHARHRPPLLRGAVPAEWRPAEPLRAAERRGRARDGHLRHHEAARVRVPAPARDTRSTPSWTTSSRPRSAVRT